MRQFDLQLFAMMDAADYAKTEQAKTAYSNAMQYQSNNPSTSSSRPQSNDPGSAAYVPPQQSSTGFTVGGSGGMRNGVSTTSYSNWETANWNNMTQQQRQAWNDAGRNFAELSDANYLSRINGQQQASQPAQQAPSQATQQGMQRWNVDAPAQDRLNKFKTDTFEAQKELALVKQMYESEKAGGASADRLNAISSWADQVRGVSGISADDPVFGNSANQSDANVQKFLQNMQGVDQAKLQSPGSNDLMSKYQQMMNDYMKQYQDQLSNMKAADAQKAQQAAAEREARKQGMLGNFKSQYNAALAGQQADLTSAKAQSVADLQKAYDDAVASGDMSVKQAKAAFDAQKTQLEQQQYQQAQSRNLLSSQRGIGNSQQLLGMEATDQANIGKLQAGATTARDQQLADIKNRLDSIGNTKNTETARINEQYNANLNKAKSQSDLAYQSAVNNLDVNDYNADRNFSEQMMQANRSMDLGALNANMSQMNQLAQMGFQADTQAQAQQAQFQNAIQLANQGNLNQLGLLAKQQGYDLEKMAAANGYDMQKLGSSQEFQKMMGELQQGYTKENLGIQQGYTQDNMGLKYSYDSKLQGAQLGAQASMASAARANAVDLAMMKSNIKTAEDQKAYETAVSREKAKFTGKYEAYTPGDEKAILDYQKTDAAKQRQKDMIDKLTSETNVHDVLNNPLLPQAMAQQQNGTLAPPGMDFSSIFGRVLSPSLGLNGGYYGNTKNAQAEYEAKMKAIADKQALLGK